MSIKAIAQSLNEDDRREVLEHIPENVLTQLGEWDKLSMIYARGVSPRFTSAIDRTKAGEQLPAELHNRLFFTERFADSLGVSVRGVALAFFAYKQKEDQSLELGSWEIIELAFSRPLSTAKRECVGYYQFEKQPAKTSEFSIDARDQDWDLATSSQKLIKEKIPELIRRVKGPGSPPWYEEVGDALGSCLQIIADFIRSILCISH